jgi:hypothetical protein
MYFKVRDARRHNVPAFVVDRVMDNTDTYVIQEFPP